MGRVAHYTLMGISWHRSACSLRNLFSKEGQDCGSLGIRPSRTPCLVCRAAFLLKGAMYVVNSLGGALPSTASELAKIPGIGPYTSAAIASIAFNEAAAVVDGNVMRVMSRLFKIPGNPKEKAFTNAVAVAASSMLHLQRPGDWNQAVMELGASVCRPSNPVCDRCAVVDFCAARIAEQAGSGIAVTSFPGKATVVAKRVATAVACVLVLLQGEESGPHGSTGAKGGALRKRGHVLLVKRPEKGLLPGMWEVPTADLSAHVNDVDREQPQGKRTVERDDAISSALSALALEHETAVAVKAAVKSAYECGSFVHQFSHISLTTQVLRCDVCMGQAALERLHEHCASTEGMKLVQWSALKGAGISTLTDKVLQAASTNVLAVCASKKK
jgi:A/G-specific adenine glycosylase